MGANVTTPASLKTLRQYWNLPGSDDDARFNVESGGLWDPKLDPTADVQNMRAVSRREMAKTAEQASIDDLPIDQRAQAQYFQTFNHRLDGVTPEWDGYVEALNEMGQGGKQVKLQGGEGLPVDQHRGTLPTSLQNVPGAAYAYDDFGAPIAIIHGGKPVSPEDQQAQRKAAQPKPWGIG